MLGFCFIFASRKVSVFQNCQILYRMFGGWKMLSDCDNAVSLPVSEWSMEVK